MKQWNYSSERGQALVLVVLALVVLLGFTAIAVDGSMVYSDRRYAQSAADAASLAGGSVAAAQMEKLGVNYQNWTASPPNCTGKVATAGKTGREAAVKRAKDNSFTIDQNIKDGMGVVSECGIEPIYVTRSSGPAVKIFDDKYMDMRTMITSQTDTAFAHFVFRGPMVNTVSAVTRVRPRQPLAYGYAIVALNDSPCSGNSNGVQYHGLGANAGSLTVNGGGVFSNGCMDSDGNVTVTINNGAVNYFNTQNLSNITMNPSGTPTQLVDNDANRIPPDAYNVPAPDCSGHDVSASYIINYYKDNAKPLPSGLYCVTGDMMVNGGDRIEGYGVTLVLNGRLSVNGGATIKLSAPPGNYVGDAMAGIVVYAPKSNTGEIQLNGSSDSYFQGTVLATGATVDLNGNSMNEAFKSQVIAWNVKVGGSTGTNVTYQSSEQTSKPAAIDLYR